MKPKMRMLTVVKPHKYGTRHLTAGEEYEAPVRHALALVASKKARFAVERPPQPPPPSRPPVRPPEPAAGALSEIERLRMQALALGIEVDGRWGMARLQYQINKATAG